MGSVLFLLFRQFDLSIKISQGLFQSTYVKDTLLRRKELTIYSCRGT